MSCLNRALLAGIILFLATTRVAWSIEPNAPTALISQDEAIVVSIRQRLDELPESKEYKADADRDSLGQFYTTHGRAIWVSDGQLSDRAKAIIEEIKQADNWGLDASQFELPAGDAAGDLSGAQLIDIEMTMSLAVLKYARHARGGRMDPKDLSLAIDRTLPLEDPKVVLTSLLDADEPAAYLRSLHPQHEQFEKLRLAYLKALDDEANPPAQATEPEPTKAEKNKKKRKAKRSKKRKRSKTKLSQRLLYNMEMWRWMPRELGEKHIIANIPEYRFRVIKNGQVVHAERIVTGKVKNKTPIFSDEMETIVFHPFWGVPNSIKVKELLPKLVRGGDLEKQNLRMSYGGRPVDPQSVDWTTTDIRKFHVFQPPSRRNALGVVKFMFPNKHAVYMHDTPSKHLFKRKDRAFSHGCVRVRNPLKLAEVLLNNDKGWGRSKVDALIDNGPKNNQIGLDKKLPVHLVYFTAKIDEDGKPVLYKDIYGHERLIQMGLDGKSHLIVKKKPNLDTARRRVVSNSGSSFYKKKNSDWMERIFNN